MEEPLKITKKCTHDEANVFKKFFFIWLVPIFNTGYKKDLEFDDLMQCSDVDDPAYVTSRIEGEWMKELSKQKEDPNYSPSILKAIWKVFWFRYLLTNQITFWGEVAIRLFQPLMVGTLVKYLSQTDADINRITDEVAYGYAAAIIVSSVVFAFSRHIAFVLVLRIGNNIRTALTVMIYKKVLKLSKSSFEKTNIGNILNVLANDLLRFEDFSWQFIYLLIAPVMSIIVIYLCWYYLGVACVGGLVILLLFIPFQGLMGRLFSKYRRKTTALTDQRVKLMGEIISAMKLIKVYCWESPFAQLVAQIREKEVRTIRSSSILKGINTATFFVATRIMLFASFITYVLIGNHLTAETVFVVMSLFNAIRIPVTNSFPQAIGYGAETLVAAKRTEQLLMLEERGERIVPNDPDARILKVPAGGIRFSNYCGRWTKSQPSDNLKDINLEVSPGELIVVIGSVGSGKTCLLYSLLNEIETFNGYIMMNGSTSYAPQESWCFGGTIRDNILLGSPFCQEKYDRVIHVCGLERDMKLFPMGDATFVGEKGYTLSGGQKARVTLARSIYNDADYYLLDDPLSAVDPRVANHIFERCIKDYLKAKTVVLVTHQLQFIKRADRILIMRDGEMVALGSYDELIQSSHDFLAFLNDTEKKEQERKSSLSKQKSLSIKRDDSEEDNNMTGKEKKRTKSEVDELNDEMRHLREEEKVKGSVGFAVYWGYLRTGAPIYFLVLVFILSFGSQAIFHYTDLWLADWTKDYEIQMKDCVDVKENSTLYTMMTSQEIYINCTKEIEDNFDFNHQRPNVILYCILISVLFVMAFMRTTACYYLCLRCSVNLHDIIFKAVLRAPMNFFENNPLGRILNRFTRDVGIIDQVIPFSLVDLNMNLINVTGIIAVSIYVNQWLAIPCFILGCMSVPVRMYYVRTGRDLQRLDSLARSPVYTHISATFEGLTTVRAFGLEGKFTDQYLRYMKDSVACRFLVICSSRIIGLILDGFANCYISAICIMLISVPKDTIPGGQAGLILSSSLMLIGMFQYGVRLTAEFETQMVSAERVLEYGKLESEAPLRIVNKIQDDKWPQTGSIEFKSIYLRYSKNMPAVLSDINFVVDGGQKIGIVGRTGAGKSSLISVLFRLVEPIGQVIIDGVDTKTLGLHELREKISIIPQDPTLFSGTIRQNLDPFKEYSDEDMWHALTSADLDSAVKSMPGELDAVVTEGGSNLSVGQRQLLCLARALLKSNKILVLDEATANVDHETDELIQKTIKTGFTDCTVLTVAHRLNTIIDMDKVMVLDAGSIVEFDEPYILLKDPHGFFYSMVQQTGPEFEKMLHQMAESFYFSKHRTLVYGSDLD